MQEKRRLDEMRRMLQAIDAIVVCVWPVIAESMKLDLDFFSREKSEWPSRVLLVGLNFAIRVPLSSKL